MTWHAIYAIAYAKYAIWKKRRLFGKKIKLTCEEEVEERFENPSRNSNPKRYCSTVEEEEPKNRLG